MTTVARHLDGLTPQRRRHCLEVARKAAAAAAELVDPAHLVDLVTAAQLHDIGYRPDLAVTGFHPLDGAAALRHLGFSDLTCHLVATHTGAVFEARARDISGDLYEPYDYDEAVAAPLRAVLAWADLTTGPGGATVTVGERLDEILTRYPVGNVVHRHTLDNLPWLTRAGSDPLGALSEPTPPDRRTGRGG